MVLVGSYTFLPFHPLFSENVMQPDRKALLLAQVLITFMMAL